MNSAVNHLCALFGNQLIIIGQSGFIRIATTNNTSIEREEEVATEEFR